MISNDLKDREFVSDEMLETLDYDVSDIMNIGEELENLEFFDYLDDDELDILKGLIAYLLMKDSSYEKEEIFFYILRSHVRICGSYGLMGFLCRCLAFVKGRFFRDIILPVCFFYELSCSLLGLCRNPVGISSHICYQSDRTFFAEFYAFIELLGHHHRLFSGKA